MRIKAGNLDGMVVLWELSERDRAVLRRHYRVLRMAIYAPQGTPWAERGMCQGWYGLSREEAKAKLVSYWAEVDEAYYIGSK